MHTRHALAWVAAANPIILPTKTKVIAMSLIQKTLVAAIIAALAIAGIYEARHAAQRRRQNQNPHQELTPLANQRQRSQNEIADGTNRRVDLLGENPTSKSSNDRLEMLRLQGEEGLLSQLLNSPDALNTGLSQSNGTRSEILPQEIAKATLEYAGYATPPRALQTFYWSATKGDLKHFFASVTPETNLKILRTLQESGHDLDDTNSIQQNVLDLFSALDTLRIKSVRWGTTNTVLVDYEGEHGEQSAMMVKIGDEWKYALLP